MQLRLKANAKINLFLEVLDRRSDGYHNIETVFQSIELHDVVELRRNTSGHLSVKCDNGEVPSDSSNIAYKAAELMADESGTQYGVSISITKRIPVGAGLAGGSANAAAALTGLNDLWELGYGVDELMNLGEKLGADVPFCIMGGTALGRGRGGDLAPLKPFAGIPLVLANPGFQVSTAWAYKSLKNLGLTRERKSANILIGKLQQNDVRGVGRELFNIFEGVVPEEYPLVRQMKDELIRCGASGALMTGSGPTVFGLAQDEESVGRIHDRLSRLADFCIVTRTSNTSIIRM